ncbi:MAG: DUF2169 domain-containing protein [Deltaproteobacteria bacterium]|nr:MAG: DUF2169 domain-containing protein [Deltaproteobacteria bacterium]
MPEFEQHGYQGFWLPGRRLNGDHGVVVVIKRRYNVNTVEAICEPSDETPPVAFAAEFHDDADPPNVSVRQPSEIAPEKRFVDVMVRGTAYAPGGKPVPEFAVEMRIPGVVTRRLRIIGDRKCIWYPPMKELTYKDLAKGETWAWLDPDFTDPEPIEKLPLRYENAYGGWGKIILSDDEMEMAEEAQGVAEVQEKRRERKKEIEEEIKAAEKADKDAAAKKKEPKPKDEKAQKLAQKAFGDEEEHSGTTRVLDADLVARLNAEADADDEMKVVSALRLGRDLPDRPEDVEPEDAAAEGEGDGDEDAEGEAAPKEKDPMADFFSGSEKTQSLDLEALKQSDELRELLEEEDERRARQLKDEEGTLRDRATEFGDIKLSGDDWAAQYMRQRPKKKKKTREESEYPEMPYPANPSGKGFACSHREEAIADLPLPNIEDPDAPLTEEDFVVELNEEFDLKKLRPPAGWAPYPMSWFPRAQYFGIFPWDEALAEAGKQMAMENYDPEDPDDQPIIKSIEGVEIPLFNMLAYQEAHPKLWVKHIRGDEEVYFTNLTPEGHLFFRLPGLHPTATIDMSEGPVPLAMNLDQLLFDLDDPARPAVELLWRGWHKIRDFDELGEKPFRKVNIIEVDQVDWMDVKRDEAAEEAGLKKGGVTGFIEAIDDEDLEKDVEQKYRDQFRRKDDRLGVRMDGVEDAVVFNQTEDRRLYGDDWDEKIRAEKQGFEDDAAARAAAAEKEHEKEIKKKAREQVDEEFGIIRDDDGEILVIDEDMADGAPPKGKKK